MANELAIVEDNWLELAGKHKDLPMPFEQMPPASGPQYPMN